MTDLEREFFLAALGVYQTEVFGCGTTKMQSWEQFIQAGRAFWLRELAEGHSIEQVLARYSQTASPR